MVRGLLGLAYQLKETESRRPIERARPLRGFPSCIGLNGFVLHDAVSALICSGLPCVSTLASLRQVRVLLSALAFRFICLKFPFVVVVYCILTLFLFSCQFLGLQICQIAALP